MGRQASVTCNPATTYIEMVEYLQGLDLGILKHLKIVNCPVPEDSFQVLSLSLSLSSISILLFYNNCFIIIIGIITTLVYHDHDHYQYYYYHFINLGFDIQSNGS